MAVQPNLVPLQGILFSEKQTLPLLSFHLPKASKVWAALRPHSALAVVLLQGGGTYRASGRSLGSACGGSGGLRQPYRRWACRGRGGAAAAGAHSDPSLRDPRACSVQGAADRGPKGGQGRHISEDSDGDAGRARSKRNKG